MLYGAKSWKCSEYLNGNKNSYEGVFLQYYDTHTSEFVTDVILYVTFAFD